MKDKLFWFYAFDAFRRNFPGTAKANNPGAFFINANAALNGTETCTTSTRRRRSDDLRGHPATFTPGQTASTQVLADTAACTLAARLNTTYAPAPRRSTQQLQALLPDLGSVPRFGNQLINTPKLDYQITPQAPRQLPVSPPALGFARRRADAGHQQLRDRHLRHRTS